MNTQVSVAAGGILFGLLLITALLVRREGVRRANRLLAASLACTVAYLLALICIRQDWSSGRIVVSLLASCYLFSPVFLLGYARALIKPENTALRVRDLLYVLPAACFLLLLSFGGSAISNETLEQARSGWPPNRISVAGILIYLVQISYFSRALLELQAHRRRVPDEFSYEEQVSLRWLRVLMGVSLLLSLTGLTIALTRLLPGVELWPRSIYSTSAILLVYYLIGFVGMTQPAIFATPDSLQPAQDSNGSQPAVPAEQSGERKYETSALTAETTTAYWEQLQDMMEREQPFLDNHLRIADLAAALDMPVHHLSQTINHCAQQSFLEFINSYRVDTAKNLLREATKPISLIAFDAGFNSESAFYRHFKKVTGKTPKQFQAPSRTESPS